jgi:hypothetical protein
MNEKSTYIEIDYISEEGLESNFGMKIGALINPNIAALETVKKLLPDGIAVAGARFITAEEYETEYGDEEDSSDERETKESCRYSVQRRSGRKS